MRFKEIIVGAAYLPGPIPPLPYSLNVSGGLNARVKQGKQTALEAGLVVRQAPRDEVFPLLWYPTPRFQQEAGIYLPGPDTDVDAWSSPSPIFFSRLPTGGCFIQTPLLYDWVEVRMKVGLFTSQGRYGRRRHWPGSEVIKIGWLP